MKQCQPETCQFTGGWHLPFFLVSSRGNFLLCFFSQFPTIRRVVSQSFSFHSWFFLWTHRRKTTNFQPPKKVQTFLVGLTLERLAALTWDECVREVRVYLRVIYSPNVVATSVESHSCPFSYPRFWRAFGFSHLKWNNAKLRWHSSKLNRWRTSWRQYRDQSSLSKLSNIDKTIKSHQEWSNNVGTV